MTEFIKRLCVILGVGVVVSIPVGSIVLVNILWEVKETRTFSLTEAIVYWLIMGVWIVVIGFTLTAALSGMVSDLWKVFKWLFVDPFKGKSTKDI